MLGSGKASARENVSVLLGSCLDELSMLIDIAPSSYKVDLLAICFYIYSGNGKMKWKGEKAKSVYD